MFADTILLRFTHPRTGEVLATRVEAEAMIQREALRADAEMQRADAEAQARREAEIEIEKLKAELARLRPE